MSLKNQLTRTGLFFSLSVFALGGFLFNNPTTALAEGRLDSRSPGFSDFVALVQNGDANVLRGVYVHDVLALPVTQQPDGDANYVSRNDGEATQFSTATHYGTIGILAHNNLSGRSFSELAVGQEVRLVYGDGRVEHFIIADILQYQALEPANPWSEFRDLESNQILSTTEMFERVYAGDAHLTFQTCIEADGNLSWGRLFIMAVPVL